MAIYLKFGSINGDATHDEHKQWVQVDSVQWGVGRAITTPTGSTKNREASEPSISEVTVSKQMDQSSIYFFEQACVGNKAELCKIHMVSTGSPGRTYAEFNLTNALISGYSLSSGGDVPSESISVSFTKIEVKYNTVDEGGTPKPASTSYDMTTTKKG